MLLSRFTRIATQPIITVSNCSFLTNPSWRSSRSILLSNETRQFSANSRRAANQQGHKALNEQQGSRKALNQQQSSHKALNEQQSSHKAVNQQQPNHKTTNQQRAENAQRRVKSKSNHSPAQRPASKPAARYVRRSKTGEILPPRSSATQYETLEPTKSAKPKPAHPTKTTSFGNSKQPRKTQHTERFKPRNPTEFISQQEMGKRQAPSDDAEGSAPKKFKVSGKLRKSPPEFRARVSVQRMLVKCFKEEDIAGAFQLYKNRNSFEMPAEMVVPEDTIKPGDTIPVDFTPDMQALLLKTLVVSQERDPKAATKFMDDVHELYTAAYKNGIDENQYAVLLELYSSMNKTDDVLRMFKELKASGEEPRLRHFAPVLSVLSRTIQANEVTRLVEIYDEMLESVLRTNDAVAEASESDSHEHDVVESSNRAVPKVAAISQGRDGRNSGSKALKLVVQLPTSREYMPLIEAVTRLGSSPEALDNDVIGQSVNVFLTRVLADMAWDIPHPTQEIHDLLRECFSTPLATKYGEKYGNASEEDSATQERNVAGKAQNSESKTNSSATGDTDHGSSSQDATSWSFSQGPVLLSNDGTCPRCNSKMLAFDADQEELGLFKANIETNATSRDNSKKAWEQFKSWLVSMEASGYDTVVDGANLAYYATAQFSHHGLNRCWKELLKSGRSPLLILHERHFAHHVLKNDEVAQNAVKEWEASGRLFKVPRGNNDDWYWLYAAMVKGPQSGIQLISNDQMRDHHVKMNLSRFFKKWRERHMVNFHYHTPKPGNNSPFELQLFEPLPYSSRPQSRVDGRAWHFPMGDPEEAARKLKDFDETSNLHRKAAQNMSKWLKKQYNSQTTPWSCVAQTSLLNSS